MLLCNSAFNLGSLWEHLAQFERNLGQLGHNLAQLGCNLVPLERNLAPLGRNLAPLGRHLGVTWVTWGSLGCHLGVTWASAVSRLSGNFWELLGIAFPEYCFAICSSVQVISSSLSIYVLISKSRPNSPSLSGTACKLISLGEYRRGTLGCIWGHFGINLGLLWVYVDGFW